MSDQVTDLAIINNFLRDNDSAKAVVPQYNRKCQLNDKIGIGTGFWQDSAGGRQWIQPLDLQPASAGTRVVTQSRVDASAKSFNRAVYDPRSYIESAIHIDFNAMNRAKGTGRNESHKAVITSSVMGAAEAIATEKARQTMMANAAGTLCYVTVTTGATDANILTFQDVEWERVMKRKFLTLNDKVDGWPATWSSPTSTITAGAPVFEGRKVTAITPSSTANSSTITLDGPALTTATIGTVQIAVAGNRTWDGSTNDSNELTSLQVMADNTTATTVGGLTSATDSQWAGVTYDPSGSATNTAFSLASYMAFLELIDANQVDISAEEYYTFCDRKRFNNALTVLTNSTNQAVRYNSTAEAEGKFTESIPLMQGTTLVPERLAPPNEILGAPKRHLQYITPDEADIKWVEQAPMQYVRWDGNHGYEGMAYWHGDLVTDRRGAVGRLRYIT